jgi:hypothetical protein
MVTHEWMVKPMPQREWIERRGMMVWIAEVFTSLGSGLFLVSLFMNSWWGMVVGWLIIMFLKLPVHLAYFGKPLRFYRTIPPFSNAWKTSWFARGILFTILFSGFAFVAIVVGHPYVADLMGTAAGPVLRAPSCRYFRSDDRSLRRLYHELLQERSLLEHRHSAYCFRPGRCG